MLFPNTFFSSSPANHIRESLQPARRLNIGAPLLQGLRPAPGFAAGPARLHAARDFPKAVVCRLLWPFLIFAHSRPVAISRLKKHLPERTPRASRFHSENFHKQSRAARGSFRKVGACLSAGLPILATGSRLKCTPLRSDLDSLRFPTLVSSRTRKDLQTSCRSAEKTRVTQVTS
jgi:hypothetical protein